MAYDNRLGMWFGTQERMRWIPVPLRGADSSPVSWGVDGTLLNGGAYVRNAWSSHKRYTYEWNSSSSREVAQIMKSYRDGSYGRGLLYFIDPLTYTTNVLAPHFADPSMTRNYEAPEVVAGIQPSPWSHTSGAEAQAAALNLPAYRARFDIPAGTAGQPEIAYGQFIPIPEGYTLHMGAFYEATGTAGVFVTPVSSAGALQPRTQLTPLSLSATNIVPDTFTGGRGVWLSMGRTDIGASAILTVSGVTARLAPTGTSGGKLALLQSGPWVGGQGNNGVRFVGTPSYISNGPLGGGQIGFAATFAEVGSWEGK